MKLLRHLLLPHAALDRRFPKSTLDAIQHAVAGSETRHSGEIRVAIEVTLDLAALRRVATPRDRALEVFGELHVWDTAQRNGVLIYVLLAERDVEIVADRGLDGRVGADEWRSVCEGMEREFRHGRWRDGALAGIAGVTALLAREFPATGPNRNEQPDRPAIL
jgi:uncharacterized membrane protein